MNVGIAILAVLAVLLAIEDFEFDPQLGNLVFPTSFDDIDKAQVRQHRFHDILPP